MKKGFQMTWDYARAKERIQRELSRAPAIETKRYSDQYLPYYEMLTRQSILDGKKTSPPLVNLEKGVAVLVNTVQIYINLINFNDYLLSQGQETERSHKRALEFLHLYYSACDRVIDKSHAQRVDFHGARLHMVVLDESGRGISEGTVASALRLVNRFRYLAKKANEELGNNAFPVKIRVGIDAGLCVAINNGTGSEQEPMFLGSAANHAAKNSEGEEEGIFISPRVSQKIHNREYSVFGQKLFLNDENVSNILDRNRFVVDGTQITENKEQFAENVLNEWRSDIERKAVTAATDVEFSFFYKQPPLSELDFTKLMPSKTARLPVASIFADISGYTDYIDSCIDRGDIEEAVRTLYVIRAEFQNVVEKDFEGRKIRFIGDCIQAVLAEGDNSKTDDAETAYSAISCCGGLRSSFELCLNELQNNATLGLAIGVELGNTPITRLGIRGERSVRIASSNATASSEELQSCCEENETRIGPIIRQAMPIGTSDLFDKYGISSEPIYYDDIAAGLASPAIINSHSGSLSSERAHTPQSLEFPRAHIIKL